MQQGSVHDSIRICTDETDMARVHHILAADPIWAAYALADLQPGFAVDCRWLTATGGKGDAVALIYYGLQPPVLFTMGEPQALAAILAHAELPDAVYASISAEHLAAVSDHYAIAGDLRPMRRMVLANPQAVVAGTPYSAEHGAPVVSRLSGAHVGDVLQLLTHNGPFTPDAFSPAQMNSGVFYGLHAGSELLAVGGTHIVDFTTGIAAIGNMYTHPAYRRHGYSAVILRAIVKELLERGVMTIVLNVDQRNPGAHALYLAHGFIVHVPYFEGKGNRNMVCVL